MDLTAIKDTQKAMWAAGDFPDLAKYILPASGETLGALDPQSGDRLLDIAAGTGNLAIPAAQRGVEVVGLDITPELLEVARTRAADASVDIEFIEGDAEDLPFEDDAFKLVASVFGIIFAPRHKVAADEMVRVCEPGGHFAMTAWTPEGMNGKLFQVMGAHMPPPPPGVEPPITWGSEDHIREMFDGSGAELTFSRHTCDFTADSVEEWVSYNERALGPVLFAKEALEPQGKWDELRAGLVGHYNEFNIADDGTFIGPGEYILAVGSMPA
ncbi:MAG: class I SAM-dependent methyltransferase [Solirubrobacterales bacterium]